MAYTLRARCIDRFPRGDRTEPGNHPTRVRLQISDGHVVGEMTISVTDSGLSWYMQEGKEYDLTLALAPYVEQPAELKTTA